MSPAMLHPRLNGEVNTRLVPYIQTYFSFELIDERLDYLEAVSCTVSTVEFKTICLEIQRILNQRIYQKVAE
jgi:hypothetical protein